MDGEMIKKAEDVISQYKGLLFYVIKPIVNDENLIEDCFNSVCVKISENIASYDDKKGSLTGWLTVIARNTAINFAKKRGNAVLSGSEEPETMWQEAVAEDTPEDVLLKKESFEELSKVLSTLKSSEIKLLLRKYYYLQSTDQISREMCMTERSVEGKLYRIKKKLRNELKKNQGKGGVQNDRNNR